MFNGLTPSLSKFIGHSLFGAGSGFFLCIGHSGGGSALSPTFG